MAIFDSLYVLKTYLKEDQGISKTVSNLNSKQLYWPGKEM